MPLVVAEPWGSVAQQFMTLGAAVVQEIAKLKLKPRNSVRSALIKPSVCSVGPQDVSMHGKAHSSCCLRGSSNVEQLQAAPFPPMTASHCFSVQHLEYFTREFSHVAFGRLIAPAYLIALPQVCSQHVTAAH